MLSVCASSTDLDLTTTGALKGLLNTTSTARDAYYSDVIRRASRWVEGYVGRPLTLQSYQESVAGYSRRSMMLARTPLRAVPRFFNSTDTGTGVQVLTSQFRVENADAGLISRDEGFYWSATLEGSSFDAAMPLSVTPLGGQETKPWLVDYVAGYTYAGVTTSSPNYSTEQGTTSTGRTLPEDIEEAVLYRAQELIQGGAEVQSESLGDLSVSYRSYGSNKDGELQTMSKTLLDAYRSFV